MKHTQAFKAQRHTQRVVRKSAKRALARQQATAHKSTLPASQRKLRTPIRAWSAPVKVWNGVRLANLGKRLDEVWQGIEQKLAEAA